MTVLAWMMIAGCVLIETVEQSLYRFAGLRPSKWLRFISPAVILHAAGLVLWLNLLSNHPLGEVLPLMGANFVSVAIAGRLLFGERITRRRVLGIGLVTLGFVLVGARVH
jgi:undecaprenyl phosphate-alpha-L-ara4N flippase subunit ArnE